MAVRSAGLCGSTQILEIEISMEYLGLREKESVLKQQNFVSQEKA